MIAGRSVEALVDLQLEQVAELCKLRLAAEEAGVLVLAEIIAIEELGLEVGCQVDPELFEAVLELLERSWRENSELGRTEEGSDLITHRWLKDLQVRRIQYGLIMGRKTRWTRDGVRVSQAAECNEQLRLTYLVVHAWLGRRLRHRQFACDLK